MYAHLLCQVGYPLHLCNIWAHYVMGYGGCATGVQVMTEVKASALFPFCILDVSTFNVMQHSSKLYYSSSVVSECSGEDQGETHAMPSSVIELKRLAQNALNQQEIRLLFNWSVFRIRYPDLFKTVLLDLELV